MNQQKRQRTDSSSSPVIEIKRSSSPIVVMDEDDDFQPIHFKKPAKKSDKPVKKPVKKAAKKSVKKAAEKCDVPAIPLKTRVVHPSIFGMDQLADAKQHLADHGYTVVRPQLAGDTLPRIEREFFQFLHDTCPNEKHTSSCDILQSVCELFTVASLI